MQLEHLAVVAGVRQDEDHQIDRAVTLLQPDAAFERLDISQPCFQLTGSGSPEHDCDTVPCPAIAWDRERHLGSPNRATWQPLAEAFSEAEMRGVACGITVGVGPARDAQANRRGSPGGLIEGQPP